MATTSFPALRFDLQRQNPLHLEMQPNNAGSLHLEVQRQGPGRALVKWGGKEFRLELIQISSQGEEAVVPLSDQELTTIIAKVEQTLVKMQKGPFDPAQIRQLDLVFSSKKAKDKITSYSYLETTYIRTQEQVRQKVPLVIPADLERTFPELKFLDGFVSKKLVS